jgi:hypothetical protein
MFIADYQGIFLLFYFFKSTFVLKVEIIRKILNIECKARHVIVFSKAVFEGQYK